MRRKQGLTLAGLLPALVCFGVGAPAAWARPLLILHTNDLHSHFEHAPDHDRGSYAALKAEMDKLRAEAASQGIETLVLDGGDFSEGAPLFFADQAAYSWSLLDAIGYDAVTLGNHDYLMGQHELSRLIDRVHPHYAVLAANLGLPLADIDANPAMKKWIKPYSIFRKAGLRIGVIGLTNDEFEYSWRMGPVAIDTPDEGLDASLASVRRRSDVVIALTHIGTSEDRRIARKYSGIDLVVGGHTHEYIEHPYVETAPDGRRVPVVQAGDHARVVGRLLVDIEPGKPLEILDYRLVPVYVDGPKDAGVEKLVAEARASFESEYGKEWLHETLGHSDVPLTRPDDHVTEWGAVVVDGVREAVHADVAVDSADLFGDNQDGGDISRETLLGFYPRMFALKARKGWTVWKASATGAVLKLGLQMAYRYGVRLATSGISYRVEGSGKKAKLKDVRVGGRPLHALKVYQLAFPEGIARDVAENLSILKLLIWHPKDSKVPIWDAISNKLKSLGNVPPGYGVGKPPLPPRRGEVSPAGC